MNYVKIDLLENEFIKLCRLPEFYLLLFSIPILHLLAIIFALNSASLINMTSTIVGEKGNTWLGICHFLFVIDCVLIPLIINFSVVIIFNLESKNNMWKYLKVLPIDEFDIFLHKILIIIIYTFLMLFLSLLILYICSYTLFANFLDFKVINASWFVPLANSTRIFFSTICIISFHAILCFFVSQQTFLLLISFFLPFICLYDLLSFLPYGIPFLSFQDSNMHKVQKEIWYPIIGQYEIISLLLTSLFIGFTYFYCHLKKLK